MPPRPTVTGPVTGGNGVPVVFAHTTFDLATVGYTQEEFFLAGTADAYTPTAALTSDGKWSVAASSQAAYVTRIVVDRPIKSRDFNGIGRRRVAQRRREARTPARTGSTCTTS